MQSESFDVVVVGAGPAGSSAAHYAAREGVRVCLLEQGAEIGAPVRTSGATFITKLRELGVPPHLYHPLRSLRFIGPTRVARFSYAEPVACVLDVRGLYQHLAAEAAGAGTQIRLTRRVIGAHREADGRWAIIVRAGGRDELYTARIVVDASGFATIVQRKAGLRGSVQRYGFGAEYDLYAPTWPADEAALVVGAAVAPAGYGWVFPRGGGRARAGVGVVHPDTKAHPYVYLERFRAVAAIQRDLAGAQPLEIHTGYIPSEPVGGRAVWDGLIAVGDAAGHASPLVGEGIRYAMYAGRLAGAVAGESARAGDCSARALGRFERMWKAEHGRNLRIAYDINLRLTRYTDEIWDDRIALLERLPADLFLQALMTEFTVPWAARVLRHAPRIIGPLLRSLRQSHT